jgi:hypothetical protein
MNRFARNGLLAVLYSIVAIFAHGQMAIKGRLLLAEDFKVLPVYPKKGEDFQRLNEGWQVKVWHGQWTRTDDGIQSHWESGHNPVIVYEGNCQDVVIELDFRYRQEEGKHAYVRIGPMARELDPRAYTISAWANASSQARPPGLVLEHEEWRNQGYTSVSTQIGSFSPDQWHTLRLEVIGEYALATCGGFTAQGAYPKFALPKKMIGIGVGHATHELRALRIYEALPNPAWSRPEPSKVATPIEALPPRQTLSPAVVEKIAAMPLLFDGKTLDGWTQAPLAPITLGREDIIDPDGFAKRLSNASDPLAAFLASELDDAGRAGLAALLAGNKEPRQTLSPLVRNINAILKKYQQLYDAARFQGVILRSETQALLATKPAGEALARLNRLLLEDAFDRELMKSPKISWIARDGVLASTGAGRGVIYTNRDFESYRLLFRVRQKSGNHFPGVLIFCQRPPAGELGLDALGGIQFGVPSAGHWDYRPGMNRSGDHFRRALRIQFNLQEWSQVEILVDGKTGKARMAIAQPVGTRAIELLGFHDPAAARAGPIALQMHNAQLFDEYSDIRIEIDPQDPAKLLTL